MKRKELLGKIETLTINLGIEIRYEKLGNSRGGLCRIHEKYYLFLNRNLAEYSKIELIAQELSKFDLTDIFLLPEIRQVIHKNRVAKETFIKIPLLDNENNIPQDESQN